MEREFLACLWLLGQRGGVDAVVGAAVVALALQRGEVEGNGAAVGIVGERGLLAA